MMKSTLCVLSAIALGSFAPGIAHAVCPATPTDWNAEDCTVNGGATNVCTWTASTYSCDFSAAGGASNLVLVSSYDGTYFIEAWGDWDGEDFCCHSPTGWSGDDVVVYGSTYGDLLSLSHPSWG